MGSLIWLKSSFFIFANPVKYWRLKSLPRQYLARANLNSGLGKIMKKITFRNFKQFAHFPLVFSNSNRFISLP